MEAYSTFTVDQLREEAKKLKVPGGLSKLNKTQLLDKIKVALDTNTPTEPVPLTLEEKKRKFRTFINKSVENMDVLNKCSEIANELKEAYPDDELVQKLVELL